MSQEERSGARAKVLGLRVRYKSATIDAFLDDAFDDLGAGGMFIRTSNPFPVTTLLKFEVEITGEAVALSGVGRVAWVRTRAQATEDAPAGMGVKFIKVDERSKQIIEAVVQRGSAGADYVKGISESIRAAAAEQHEPIPSIGPAVNPTIISVPPPVSRTNTLMGVAAPAVPTTGAPAPLAGVIVPQPSAPPEEEETRRALPESAPPSSFGSDLATEVWRRPESLIPPPTRPATPSSLRPPKSATPAPPPAAIPALPHVSVPAPAPRPSFRTPAPEEARSNGWLSMFAWGLLLAGLGGAGFWFGTRGGVDKVEPKSDAIRPAVELPSRTEGPAAGIPTLLDREDASTALDAGHDAAADAQKPDAARPANAWPSERVVPPSPATAAAETPKLAAEAAKPPTDASKPAVETPKPAVETPKPAVETPKPAVETPKPAVETPAPEVPKAEASKPTAETPKPAAETSKPSVQPGSDGT